jgi:hypothetical protein
MFQKVFLMYRLLRWLLVFSAFFPSTSSAAAADLTLGPASNYLVPVVVKGVTLNLRVDPGADGAIVINRGAAARAKLKASIFPLTAAVGPVTVRGRWTRSDGDRGVSEPRALHLVRSRRCGGGGWTDQSGLVAV